MNAVQLFTSRLSLIGECGNVIVTCVYVYMCVSRKSSRDAVAARLIVTVFVQYMAHMKGLIGCKQFWDIT